MVKKRPKLTSDTKKSNQGQKAHVSALAHAFDKLLAAAPFGIAIGLGLASLDAAGVKGLPLAYAFSAAMGVISICAVLASDGIRSLKGLRRWSVSGSMIAAIISTCFALGVYEKTIFTEEISIVPWGLEAKKINCGSDQRKVGIAFGTNFDLIHKFPFDVVVMNGRTLFRIDRQEDRLIIKTLTLFDDRHDSIATINDNVIWTRNDVRTERPNKSTLVVYDHNNDMALLVTYINRDLIQIGGIFRNLRYPLIIHGTKSEFSSKNGHGTFEHNCFEDLPIIQTDTGMGFPPSIWIDENPNSSIPKPPYLTNDG